MRLNINSHFVDASPLSRPIFFSLSRPADLSASFSLTYTFQPLFLSVDLVVSSLFHPFPPFAFCMRCGRVRRRTNTADDVYPSPLTHLIDGWNNRWLASSAHYSCALTMYAILFCLSDSVNAVLRTGKNVWYADHGTCTKVNPDEPMADKLLCFAGRDFVTRRYGCMANLTCDLSWNITTLRGEICIWLCVWWKMWSWEIGEI